MNKPQIPDAEVVEYTVSWYLWNAIVYGFAIIGLVDVFTGGRMWL